MIFNSIVLYFEGLKDSVYQALGFNKRPPGQSDGLLSPLLETIRTGHAKRWIKGKQILDCGCGRGRLFEMLDSCYQYTGIDLDNNLIFYLKEKYPKANFICGDVNDTTHLIENKKFDSIILTALIEHVINPVELLTSLKKILNTNGIIIITTPNPKLESAYHFGAKIKMFDKHADEDHEDLLTLEVLIEQIQSVGLVIDKSYRFLFGANQIVVAKKN